MPQKFRTHYDNLKVARNAPVEVIRAAYRALCLMYHPDQNPDRNDAERIMKVLNSSYEVLCDPVQRRRHDQWIGEKEEQMAGSRHISPPATPATPANQYTRNPEPAGFSTSWEQQNREPWSENSSPDPVSAARPASRFRRSAPVMTLAGLGLGIFCALAVLQANKRDVRAIRERATQHGLPPEPVFSEARVAEFQLEAERLRDAAGREMVVGWPGGAEMVFSWCPAGTFLIGSPAAETGRFSDETLTEVTITKGFWMAVTECTQAQWMAIMGPPSEFTGARFPVESVSWLDAMEFIRLLNSRPILPEGFTAALPTETQWEYACRAGTLMAFNFGDSLNGTQANCDGNKPYGTIQIGPSLRKTVPAGSFPANAWGLHDMHGNVAEWCANLYSPNSPADPPGDAIDISTAAADPTALRAIRGGSCLNSAARCRAAARAQATPDTRSSATGFRLILVPEEGS